MKGRWLVALVVGILANAARPLPAEDAPKRPNLVVIVADDLGYADIGVYGGGPIPTPHVDALAKSGIQFTSGYSGGPICSPSRVGFLTGCYQARFGFDLNAEDRPTPDGQAPHALDLRAVTIAQRLKALGYATGLVGKWHIGSSPGYRPTERGFDFYYGILPYGLAANNGAGAQVYRGTEPEAKPANHMEAFAHEALTFIDQHAEEPFFLDLAFTAVHGPMVNPEDWSQKVPSSVPGPRSKYAADLMQLDDIVGRVVAKLKEKGIDRNTLVVFYSDNGGPGGAAQNGKLRGTKWTVWEGGIRVPFIASWNGRIASGQTLDQPVIQLDILPTILAAAGVEVAPEWKIDGRNLLPLLEGKSKEAPHEALYWRFGPQYAIRQGQWKLAKPHIDSQPLLFDLSADIGEQHDVAEAHPERVKALQALWDNWNASNEPPRWGNATWNGDGPKPAKAAGAGSAGPLAVGPLRSGDSLETAKSPAIAKRGFTVSADVTTRATDGVIVAQGANRQGFAVYLADTRPAFAVRVNQVLTTIEGKAAVGKESFQVTASLAKDGTMSLLVDGSVVAEGKAAGPIPVQPADGLSVGADTKGAVGDYPVPSRLEGKVTNARVTATP
jgi:arylsulfatase A-like enzyme